MSRTRALVLAAALHASACGAGRATPAAAHPTIHAAVDAADSHAFASASNELGLDIWESLRADHGDENLSISPASIASALAMTYAGARADTATAMASTMHLSSSPDVTLTAAGELVRHWNDPSRTTYELAVANRLFGDARYTFQSSFLAATRDQMGAELQRLDFRADPGGARTTINDWVSERTHGRIPQLLAGESVTDLTRLVLVNAVYFHGRWQTTFDPDLTSDRPFHARVGDHAVRTMFREGGAYGEDEGVQLLELAYAGGDLTMLFVLPRDRDGLAAIESRLDDAQVQRWASRVGPDETTQVYLPRFRIETASLSLRAALASLGMGIAFSDAADFSAMSDPSEVPLKIDDVIHRVFVELNEEGTEAAAATGVTMVEIESASEPRMPPRFEADHPFLFFLREPSTGAILFAGRVVDPAS